MAFGQEELNDVNARHRLEALVRLLHPEGTPQVHWVYRASKCITISGKTLGIFSGSFNPMTTAHIKMIEEAQRCLGLDEILLLLAKANVDKEIFGLSLPDRLLTLERYATLQEDFSVAACSHGRFIEKIEALKTVYPDRTQFSFIVGYDTFVRIFDRKYYPTDMHTALGTLFDNCRLVVANRKGHDLGAVKRFLDTPEFRGYARYIDPIELPEFYASLSSTAIRERINRGDEIGDLVPEVIRKYIRETGAYKFQNT